MGYFGRFIWGYGILPTPLTKPHCYKRYLISVGNLKLRVGSDLFGRLSIQQEMSMKAITPRATTAVITAGDNQATFRASSEDVYMTYMYIIR